MAIDKADNAYITVSDASSEFLAAPYYAYGNGTTGILVKTDISSGTNTMFYFMIMANTYTTSEPPVFSVVQGYNYNNGGNIQNYSAINMGRSIDSFSVFAYEGHLCLWFDGHRNYETFYAVCFSNRNRHNHVTSVTVSAKPTEISWDHAITPKNIYGAYLPLSGGTLTGALVGPEVRINAKMSSGSMNAGLTFVTGSTKYFLIGQGSSNLWIGANETSGTHLSGSTFISAGGGDALRVSKLVGTTRTNYVVLDAENSKNYPSGSVHGLRESDGSRLTAGNFIKADNALYYYMITSSMADAGRPGTDGYGLHFAWDNGYWDTQMYIPNGGITSAKHVMVRGATGSANAWGDWVTLYDSLNLTKSVVTGLLGSDTYLPLSGGTVTGAVSMTDSESDYALSVSNNAYVGYMLSKNYAFSNLLRLAVAAEQWVKIGTLRFGGAQGNNALIFVRHSYGNSNNEAYVFSVSAAYTGGFSITQISGRYNTHDITKLGIAKWDGTANLANVYIYYTATKSNTIFVNGIGDFEATVPETGVTPESNLIEFETCSGFKTALYYNGANQSSANTLVRSDGYIYSAAGVRVANTRAFASYDSGGTVRNVVHMDSANNLLFGYGTAAANYSRYLEGGNMIRFRLGTGHGTVGTWTTTGLGIGTTSPSYRLHVSGNTYIVGTLTTTGDQVISSDERMKTHLKELSYTVSDIASARAVSFDWKDGRGHSAGSIAQDWEKFAPEFVHEGENGKTLSYAQLGVANSVIIAEKTVDIEHRIEELEKENAELREMLNKILEKLGNICLQDRQ